MSAPATSAPAASAVEVNRAFYGTTTDGQDDYWRYMAAPRHRMSVVLREIGRAGARSLVDLGCGNGVVLAEIGARFGGLRRAGIDLSEERIAENRRTIPGVEWHAADLDGTTELPAPLRDAFDAVVAMEIVEHLDRPREFLVSARSLARPGGALVLSTQSGPLRETERRVGHRRHWTAEEMRDLLASAGWEPDRVWNTGWPFHDLSKWWANRDPDASMARFGSRRYAAGERFVCGALRGLFALNSGSRGAQLFAVARRR